MPNDQEELKLVVNLVDNATPGLDKITEKMKDLGGTEMKNAMEAHRKQGEEITKMVKGMQAGFGDDVQSVLTFRGALLGAAGATARH
jgi:hypothetical protein